MPKVELGTFGVVAGEEIKWISGGGCFLRIRAVVTSCEAVIDSRISQLEGGRDFVGGSPINSRLLFFTYIDPMPHWLACQGDPCTRTRWMAGHTGAAQSTCVDNHGRFSSGPQASTPPTDFWLLAWA
jgi:hypothetical protein